MKNTKILFALFMFVAAVTLAAPAQTQVFVSGQTNGGFGGPIDMVVPYVPAVIVDGPATITVTYLDGTVTDAGGVNTGPNGVDWDCTNWGQLPQQEDHGIAGGNCPYLDALIGVFVPQPRAGHGEADGAGKIAGSIVKAGNLVRFGTVDGLGQSASDCQQRRGRLTQR